jgi:hypothetical protein
MGSSKRRISCRKSTHCVVPDLLLSLIDQSPPDSRGPTERLISMKLLQMFFLLVVIAGSSARASGNDLVCSVKEFSTNSLSEVVEVASYTLRRRNVDEAVLIQGVAKELPGMSFSIYRDSALIVDHLTNVRALFSNKYGSLQRDLPDMQFLTIECVLH